ncbi:MAG: hypothetical protein RL422_30 [Bacteroidota bacterium]
MKLRYSFIICFFLLFMGSLNSLRAQYPTVYFNEFYKGTGSGYSLNTNSITVGTQIVGQNFRFVGSVSGSTFTGSDVAGTIYYTNSAGSQVTITGGTISRSGGSGNTAYYFYYVNSTTGEAYLLVNPKYDSFVSGSSSNGTNSSGLNTDLNSFLSSQTIVTVNANIAGFSSCLGTASSNQTFTVSGTNLSSNITISAPTGFEVSLSSASGFSSSVTLLKGAGTSISNTIVYVRLKNTNSAGQYTGNMVVSTTNSADQNIYVFGDVTTSPAITAQPLSSVSVCAATATTFSVTATGGNLTYQWQVNNGTGWANLANTGIYYGVTTSVLRLSSSLDASYSGYKYRVIVSGSCSPSITSSELTLTVNQPVSINSQPSNAEVCANSSTSISVSATGAGLTYQWQVYSSGTWSTISNGATYSGTTSNTLSILSATSALNGLQYKCVISGTCSTLISSAAILTVNAIPTTPVAILGDATICENTRQSYSVASVNGATSYTWTLPQGWTGSSNLSAINILANTVGGTISVTANNSCGSSSATNLVVTISNIPAPLVDFGVNNATQCLSGNLFSFTNSTSLASGTSITSTSWNFGDNTTSTNSTPSHTYSQSNTYNVSLKVVASNGCSSSKSSFVIVNPAPTSTISGAQTICSGSTAPLSVQFTGTSPWAITYYDGSSSTIVSSINTANYTLNVSPTTTKTYTISSISDANCIASSGTGSATVTVNPTVTASVSILSNDADNSVCSGTAISFTATPINGGTPVYSWQKNGVDLNVSSSTFSTTNLLDDDKISVQMTSNATCVVNKVVFSNQILIHIAPAAPRTPAVISGSTIQCALGVSKLYSIVDVLDATSYTWSVPAGGWTITSGQGTINAYVTVGSTNSIGDISVYATNGCGSSTAQSLAITAVNASPSAPTATSTQSFCASSNATVGTLSATGTSLSWYNTPLLTSALSSTSSLTTGNYYVTQTSLGCESPSATITVTITENPIVTSTTPDSRCGVGTLGLGASVSSGVVRWYDASSGGTLLATGNSYTTISLSSTATYYVEGIYLGCSSTSRSSIIATIKAIPAVVSVNSGSRCSAGVVTLSGTPSSGTLVWYDLANGGTNLATSNTYTTTYLTSTTNFYVEALNNGCSSARSTVTATISQISISISGSTTAYDQVSLTASGGSTYSWSGGNNINSATNTFDESGTYTVTVTDNGGCTSSQSIQVVVNIRGLNKYGEFIDLKLNQMNRFGEEGSDFPLKNSGQIKKYAKYNVTNSGLAFHLDASDVNSYSGSGSNWIDLITSVNKGVLTNGAIYRNLFGGVIEFDGIGAYVDMQTSLGTTDNLTIEAWIFPKQVLNQQIIATMDGNTSGMVQLLLNGNQLQFDLSGESSKLANYTFKPNKWYHVAVCFAKGVKQVDFYINGRRVNSENYSSPTSIVNSKYLIGGAISNSNAFFKGNIAGFRVYNQSLNLSQITNNYNNAKVKFGL